MSLRCEKQNFLSIEKNLMKIYDVWRDDDELDDDCFSVYKFEIDFLLTFW